MVTQLWGAPRFHGELLKLGFEIAESTVSKYLIRPRGPPWQTWQTCATTRGTRHRPIWCATMRAPSGSLHKSSQDDGHSGPPDRTEIALAEPIC